MAAPVVIAGAGIAGLTAALAFADRGIPVEIHERSTALAEIGAGLQISPNASRILRRLGVLEGLRPLAAEPRALAVARLDTGAPLAAMPLGAVAERRFGAPYLVAHRADLQRVLLDRVAATPMIRLTTASRLAALETREEDVLARFEREDGTGQCEIRAPLLVGADGLWSAARRLVGDKGPATFSGRLAYRATLPAAALDGICATDSVSAFLGDRAHLVLYPIAAGRLFNLVLILDDADPGAGWAADVETAALLPRLPPMAPRLKALIAGLPRLGRWPLSTRSIWFGPEAGRAVLIGDAAHPILPFLAQGAAMGIEDAAALAESWAGTDDPRRAFARFTAARAERVARVLAASRRNGRIFHLQGPARLARDVALRALSGERMLARYDWLYGHGA